MVHSKGYESTSVQDILQAAHIGKSQFYHYFASKQELGLVIIDYYFDNWHQRLIKDILESDKKPKAKIADMLDFAMRVHQENNCKCGCFFGNLAIELSEHSEVFRSRLKQVFQLWVDHLKVILDDIMECEDLPVKTDSRVLAQVIVSMLEGGILLMKNGQDLQALINVTAVIRKLVNIR